MTNYNDGKWHGWHGGECPVHPESVLEVVGGWDEPLETKATERLVEWSNVVAFRVVKEHKEPREFWIGGGCFFNSIRDAKISGVTDTIHVREVTE